MSACFSIDVTTALFLGAIIGALAVSALKLVIEIICDWRTRR